MSECARQGCTNFGRADEFCSTKCAKIAFGISAPDHPAETERDKRNRKARERRLRKKYGDFVEFVNPDGMAHLASGSAGSAPRRRQRVRPSL